jgi:hypothetical protein
VVDRLTVVHTSQTRAGTLRPVLDALGVDPDAEAKAIQERHGVPFRQPAELGRLVLG